MTNFKPGDRVRGNHSKRTGTVREVYSLEEILRIEWDGEWPPVDVDESYVSHEDAVTTRPLVGPAPKVEAPHYVAPFEYFETGVGYYVKDGNGTSVLEVTYHAGGSTAREFAAYVAAALNARVFGEE